MKYTGVSLFSGAGGMDVGFQMSGIGVVWANDLSDDACQTYAANLGGHIHHGDINELIPQLHKYQGVDVLFGGPPCQGFSVAGKMDPSDPRSDLLWSFFEAVRIVRPKVFVCENVRALGKLTKWSAVREKMSRIARELGYSHKLLVLNSADFGVPQRRERMFFIGFRDVDAVNNLPHLESVFEKHKAVPQTVRKVLTRLGRAGSPANNRLCRAKITVASKPVLRRSPYAGMLFNGQGRPLNPDALSSTLPASMGGNRTPIIDEAHLYDNEESWVEWYHSTLMSGGDPLPFDSAPSSMRRLTVDEALRLQTFPENYNFIGRQSSVFAQIGNAVPCELARKVASVIGELLSCDEIDKKNVPPIYSQGEFLLAG